MAKEPADRHTTCSELVAAAEAALGLRRGGSPPAPQSRDSPSSPYWQLAALLAIVVVQRGGNSAGAALVVGREHARTRRSEDERSHAGDRRRRRPWGHRRRRRQRLGLQARRQHALGDRPRHEARSANDRGLDRAARPRAPHRSGARSRRRRRVVRRLRPREVETLCSRRILAGGRGDARTHTAGPPAPSWSLMALPGFSSMAVEATRCCGSTWRPARYADACDCRPTPPEALVDGLAVGGGFVWATESASAILHRIDLVSGRDAYARPGLVDDLTRLRLRVDLALRRHPGQTHAACRTLARFAAASRATRFQPRTVGSPSATAPCGDTTFRAGP